MTNKPTLVSADEPRKRSRRSFIIMTVVALLGAGIWAGIMNARPIHDAPAPLRRTLEFNGKIWQGLFNPAREAKRPPAPPRGKEPRVNGEVGIADEIDADAWRLKVTSGGREISLSLAELKLLPKTDTTAEFKCIEGWSDVIAYGGIRFSDFMKNYGLGFRPGTTEMYPYVGLRSVDGKYYVSIDTQSMLHAQTVLAYEMNGEELAVENGFPLRLVIPVKYGIKSLKQIGSIEFSNERPPDYWAERGYDWFAGL